MPSTTALNPLFKSPTRIAAPTFKHNKTPRSPPHRYKQHQLGREPPLPVKIMAKIQARTPDLTINTHIANDTEVPSKQDAASSIGLVLSPRRAVGPSVLCSRSSHQAVAGSSTTYRKCQTQQSKSDTPQKSPRQSDFSSTTQRPLETSLLSCGGDLSFSAQTTLDMVVGRRVHLQR